MSFAANCEKLIQLLSSYPKLKNATAGPDDDNDVDLLKSKFTYRKGSKDYACHKMDDFSSLGEGDRSKFNEKFKSFFNALLMQINCEHPCVLKINSWSVIRSKADAINNYNKKKCYYYPALSISTQSKDFSLFELISEWEENEGEFDPTSATFILYGISSAFIHIRHQGYSTSTISLKNVLVSKEGCDYYQPFIANLGLVTHDIDYDNINNFLPSGKDSPLLQTKNLAIIKFLVSLFCLFHPAKNPDDSQKSRQIVRDFFNIDPDSIPEGFLEVVKTDDPIVGNPQSFFANDKMYKIDGYSESAFQDFERDINTELKGEGNDENADDQDDDQDDGIQNLAKVIAASFKTEMRADFNTLNAAIENACEYLKSGLDIISDISSTSNANNENTNANNENTNANNENTNANNENTNANNKNTNANNENSNSSDENSDENSDNESSTYVVRINFDFPFLSVVYASGDVEPYVNLCSAAFFSRVSQHASFIPLPFDVLSMYPTAKYDTAGEDLFYKGEVEEGNGMASIALGQCGAKCSELVEAAKKYALAAKEGHAQAKTRLALLIMNASSSTSEMKKDAFNFFLKPAAETDPLAMYEVGSAYLREGKIVDAIEFLRMAVEFNHPDAFFQLARAYHTKAKTYGKGSSKVMKYLKKAMKYYRIAYERFHIQKANELVKSLSEYINKNYD